MTKAIDTNVAIRLLTNDDPAQALIARDTVDAGFVLTATVLLEIEWVLRSTYAMPRPDRVAALRFLLDLPGVQDVPSHAGWAIDRLAAGADFADVMHLANASAATSFVTFDRRLSRRAGSQTPIPVETLG